MAKKTRARADRTKRGHYQIGSKRPKSLVVVIGEGETEDEYFRSLQKCRYDSGLVIKVYRQPGKAQNRETTLDKLVTHAKRAEEQYLSAKAVWIVSDKDENAPHRPRLDSWLGAERKKGPKRRHCLNTPGFEHWLLLHFVGVHSAWDNCSAKQLLCSKYVKGYQPGQEIEPEVIAQTEDAVTNARKRNEEMLREVDDSDKWEARQWSDMADVIADFDHRRRIESN